MKEGDMCAVRQVLLSKGFPNHIVLPVGRKK